MNTAIVVRYTSTVLFLICTIHVPRRTTVLSPISILLVDTYGSTVGVLASPLYGTILYRYQCIRVLVLVSVPVRLYYYSTCTGVQLPTSIVYLLLAHCSTDACSSTVAGLGGHVPLLGKSESI